MRSSASSSANTTPPEPPTTETTTDPVSSSEYVSPAAETSATKGVSTNVTRLTTSAASSSDSDESLTSGQASRLDDAATSSPHAPRTASMTRRCASARLVVSSARAAAPSQ